MENEMTDYNQVKRGFFTIATGDEKYYRFASNLLKSYRLHNTKYPFAIICDRENEYTKAFDEVVIINNVKKNYQDKFRMLIDSPYYEGIFIEPDCLIYRDISAFFDMLAKESDFSSFGWNDGLLTTWFDNTSKIVEKYGEKIKTHPLFCPGYMFVRKTKICLKIYDDLKELAEWIMENDIENNPRLLCRGTLRDDPLIFIAMKLNGCICPVKPDEGKCIYYPRVKKFKKLSLKNGDLNVVQEREYNNCNLLHFTTRRCVEEGLYWHQCVCLSMLGKKYPQIVVRVFEKKFFIFCLEIIKKIKFFFIHRVMK